jgi:hypothetical protein
MKINLYKLFLMGYQWFLDPVSSGRGAANRMAPLIEGEREWGLIWQPVLNV